MQDTGSLAIFLHMYRNILVGVCEVLEHKLQPLRVVRHIVWDKLHRQITH
jgi:hypothetical protein